MFLGGASSSRGGLMALSPTRAWLLQGWGQGLWVQAQLHQEAFGPLFAHSLEEPRTSCDSSEDPFLILTGTVGRYILRDDSVLMNLQSGIHSHVAFSCESFKKKF